MNVKWLAVGAVLAGWATGATAAPLVQIVGGLQQTYGDFTPFDIKFLPFDPAQGVLQSVTLELLGSLTPELFSDNTNKLTTTTLTTQLFVFATNDFLARQTVTSSTQTVSGVTQTPSLTSTRFTGAPVNVDTTFTFTDVAAFTSASATAQTLFEYGFRTSAVPFPGGTGSDTTRFTGRAIVTYNLATAVPEPATMLAFGTGLLGLGYVRRRMR